MNPSSPPARWPQLAAPLAIAALLLWLLSARFELPGAPMDEGTLLVYPEQILQGRLPYRDFDTAYGPANPFLLAGVYAFSGPGIFVERAVGLLYRVLILAALFALARRWGSHAAAGCMLLAGIFLIPTNLVAYAWMGGMACALWFLWAATSDGTVWRKFWAGVLAAGALLYRADLGPSVVLPAVALAAWMTPRERKFFAAGAACGLLPLAGLALVVGPLRLYENLFHFPVLKSGRWLPVTLDSGWMLWILGLHFTGCVAAIWSGWRAARQDARGALLFALGLCALGCSHQALQRFDNAHLFFSCFISIGILPLTLLTAVELQCGRRASASRALLAVATVLLAVAITSPALVLGMHDAVGKALSWNASPTPFVRVNTRVFPLPSEQELRRTSACIAVVQQRARAGDRLFVGPHDLHRTAYNDTFLYHLLPHLTPATYFLEMNPGSANRPGSRLAADIASADWLILNAHWNETTRDRPADHAHEAPYKVVRTRFTLVHLADGFAVFQKRPPIARN